MACANLTLSALLRKSEKPGINIVLDNVIFFRSAVCIGIVKHDATHCIHIAMINGIGEMPPGSEFEYLCCAGRQLK